MQPSGNASPVARLSVTVPKQWWELPLRSPSRRDDIARMMGEWARQRPEPVPARAALAQALEGLCDRAVAMGAVCAYQCAATQADPVRSVGLIVAFEPLAEPDVPMLRQVQALDAANAAAHEYRASQVTPAELMWAGAAVRRFGRRPLPGGAGEETVLVQYFVPVPRSTAAAVLTFTSPTARAERGILAVSRCIADTLTFLDADGRPVPPRTTPPGRATPASGRIG